MIKLPKTLSFRLTLWYISAFATFLVSAVVILSVTINTILNKRINDDLEDEVLEFKQIYSQGGIDSVLHKLLEENLEANGDGEFIHAVDIHGRHIEDSGQPVWDGPEASPKAIAELYSSLAPVLADTEINSGEERSSNMREIYGLISPELILHYGQSLEQNEEIMDTLYSAFLLMLAIVLPLASFVGWQMARNAVKGIDDVRHIAAAIHSGQLDRRVQVSSKEQEILDLANTFNAMLDRIRELVIEMQNMIDNIAHDLRSPLTRIRIISESILSNDHSPEEIVNSASQTIEECDRMLQMINLSLDIAEAESGTGITSHEILDLSEIVKDACELFEPVAKQNDISLHCQIQAHCEVKGSVSNLQRMISNLLDNALKYTLVGGQVSLDLKFDKETVSLDITDTGIGIPSKELPLVFDRFYRSDQSRTKEGCGLGLSYARAVARGHGGDISVTSQTGNGSTFTVSLPR